MSTNLLDILQQYLKAGKKPPPQLLAQLAQSEALQKPDIDPINIPANAAGVGWAKAALGELLNPLLGATVPPLLKMAQRPVSGSANPIREAPTPLQILSGTATSDLSPQKTGELGDVMLPGGVKVAKGTKDLEIPEGISAEVTHKLNPSDVVDMALGDPDMPFPQSEASANLLKPAAGITTPLSPQGALTEHFGKLETMAKAHPGGWISSRQMWPNP